MSANLDQLREYIARAERELMYHKDVGNDADDLAVLFTGNWHDSIPRNIILNQTLLPVEKITWQSIRLTVHQPQQPGSTPKREELAMMVNCSPPTITKARQMLRLCRYTTLCSVLRKKGKFVGEIHLLHDEPMDLGTTIELDPTYIEFVQALAKASNKTPRLRKEASTVLRELNKLGAVPAPHTNIDRMAQRVLNPQGATQPRASNSSGASRSSLPVNQSKNLPPADFSQRKNFALDGFLNDPADLSDFNAKPVDNHQSKNLSSGDFLSNFDQSKNLSPAVCSSYCSSSKYINIFNTHARDNESTENTGQQQEPAPSFSDWDASAAWQDFDADRFSAHDDQAEPLRESVVPTPAPRFPEVPDSQVSDSYLELNPELDFGGTEEFRALITRFLPEIDHRQLDRYVDPALFSIQPQIPFIAKIVSSLTPPKRRDVLYQFLARKAGYIHGWCSDDIGNPVGFIKTLVNKIYKGHFNLDTFAAELIRAVREDDRPYIHDSADMIAKKKEFEYGGEMGQDAAGGYLDA